MVVRFTASGPGPVLPQLSVAGVTSEEVHVSQSCAYASPWRLQWHDWWAGGRNSPTPAWKPALLPSGTATALRELNTSPSPFFLWLLCKDRTCQHSCTLWVETSTNREKCWRLNKIRVILIMSHSCSVVKGVCEKYQDRIKWGFHLETISQLRSGPCRI